MIVSRQSIALALATENKDTNTTFTKDTKHHQKKICRIASKTNWMLVLRHPRLTTVEPTQSTTNRAVVTSV